MPVEVYGDFAEVRPALQKAVGRLSVFEAESPVDDGLDSGHVDRANRVSEEAVRAMSSLPSGHLRLSLPVAFGRIWVAPRLPEFLARYPGIRLDVSYADRYVDLIAEGFDAGVRIGEMQDSRLVGRRLATTRRLLCAAPAYLEARPSLTEADDLLQHECTCFTRLATHPVWHLHRDGRSRALKVNSRLEMDDAQAVVQAALAGSGVIMATDWLVGRELAEGRLVHVLPDWQVQGETGVSVVRASIKHEPAKTRAFVEWIAGIFAKPPWL